MALESPGQNRPTETSIVGFTKALHADENALIAKSAAGEEAVGLLAKFMESHMTLANMRNFQSAVQVDHSLWRIMDNSQFRAAAVELIPFVDPWLYGNQQAQMVAVIGRFVSTDENVKRLLTEISEGDAMGLVCLNTVAINKATEKLRSTDEVRSIPTQAEDLAGAMQVEQ